MCSSGGGGARRVGPFGHEYRESDAILDDLVRHGWLEDVSRHITRQMFALGGSCGE